MLISFIYILCSSRASTLPLWKEEEEEKVCTKSCEILESQEESSVCVNIITKSRISHAKRATNGYQHLFPTTLFDLLP